MVNELLDLITETLDEKNIRYLRAEGERIIVRFDNDDTVCMYRVTEVGVIFRTFYDLGKNVAGESRGNVLECVNSINLSIMEGSVCIDEDGGIVYSAFIEDMGWGGSMKKRILRVLCTALETEKNYLADIKNVIYGGSFERGNGTKADTTVDADNAENFSEYLAECSDDVFMAYYKKDLGRIREVLYGEDISDSEVLWKVYEGEKLYQDEGRIANYVIMGGPGSGKTTLAKKLADYYDKILVEEGDTSEEGEDRLLLISPADLKGPHLGHTRSVVFNLLKKACLEKKIIYIDEAYEWTADSFGREALSMLLPVMSGDRDEIVKAGREGEDETFIFSQSRTGWVPPIWLGGYEKETRNMMDENKGLYRRVSAIVLADPRVEDLYQCLAKLCKEDNVLKEVIECPDNRKVIEGYFAWGIQPEHNDYFAGYAGVEGFYSKLSAYLSEDMSEEQKKMFLFKIIRDRKKEIERQREAIGTRN